MYNVFHYLSKNSDNRVHYESVDFFFEKYNEKD